MPYVEAHRYDLHSHNQNTSIAHVSSASSSQYSRRQNESTNAETFIPTQHPFDEKSHMSFSNNIPPNGGSISMMSGPSATIMDDPQMLNPPQPPDDTISAISSRAPPSRISSSTSSSFRKQRNDFYNMQQQLNEMKQAKMKSDAEHRAFVQMAQQQMTTMFETVSKLQIQNEHIINKNASSIPTPMLPTFTPVELHPPSTASDVNATLIDLLRYQKESHEARFVIITFENIFCRIPKST